MEYVEMKIRMGLGRRWYSVSVNKYECYIDLGFQFVFFIPRLEQTTIEIKLQLKPQRWLHSKMYFSKAALWQSKLIVTIWNKSEWTWKALITTNTYGIISL